MRDPEIVNDVARALRTCELRPQSLTLEIVETTMMEDTEATIRPPGEFTALGVEITVDDFGTGYSSLSYLQRFPTIVLKVDKSFIDEIAHKLDVAALTEGIVQLAGKLNLTVVAEAIETSEQAAILRAMHWTSGRAIALRVPPAETRSNRYSRSRAASHRREQCPAAAGSGPQRFACTPARSLSQRATRIPRRWHRVGFVCSRCLTDGAGAATHGSDVDT